MEDKALIVDVKIRKAGERNVLTAIQDLRVTVTGGVPTVLMGLLGVLERQHYDLSSLRCVPCGGSAVPESLLKSFD